MRDVDYDFPITKISCPIENIMGVWKFKRPPFFKYLCYSLSGHLLHLVTKGSYIVKINGIGYEVNEGDVIYYYESEEVETIGKGSEVVFYSVSYLAPSLLPLPVESRVFSADKELQRLFYQLYDDFSSEDIKTKSFTVYATLLNILSRIRGVYFDTNNPAQDQELWWAVERRIRKDKIFRPVLDELVKISGYSKVTLIRSCRKSTGDTPINRMRKIRMEEAKSLLNFADLNVTQVAEYLGYTRIHEFSREFSRYYGEPPSRLISKQNNAE